jgi:hypothetical protein
LYPIVVNQPFPKMTDTEGKKKVEYNAERKVEGDRDFKYVVDKIKTDARAVGNKV